MPDSSLSLALAFYRAPLEHQELRHTQFSLPADTDHLLRIASGNGIAGGNVQNLSESVQDASLDELQEAAIFFIQQIFFADGTNHYQVLGLNPGADQKRIKEHHRLLIRLFHPDRQQAQEIWTEVYAERVNEAYNVLRKPDSRRAYDATLASGAETLRQTPRATTASPFNSHTRTIDPKISTRRLPRFLQRNLPQTLLAGSAFVAALLVFGVYLSNHPSAIITLFYGEKQIAEPLTPAEASIQPDSEQQHQSKTAAANAAASAAANIEQHLAQIKSKPETKGITATDNISDIETNISDIETAGDPVISSEPFSAAAISDDHEEHVTAHSEDKDILQKAIKINPQSSAADTVAYTSSPPTSKKPLNIESDLPHNNRKQYTLKQDISDRSIDVDVGNTVSTSIEEPVSKPPVTSPEKTTTIATISETTPRKHLTKTTHSEVSGVELEILTSLFIGAYERGNIDELMTLFDERANANNKSGKSNIRQDYESFFVKTRSRQMSLRQIRWQRNGLFASGRGLYQVKVKGDEGTQNYTGTIRFEVRKKNKRVLITKLSHKALF